MNSDSRIGGNKIMDMVRLYTKIKNFNTFFFSNFFNNLLKPLFNFTDENRFPSFRTPYQVVVNEIYLTTRMFVFHIRMFIAYINALFKYFLISANIF